MFWKDRSIDRQNFCDQILLFLDFFSSLHFASFCGGTKTYSALTERIFFVTSALFRLFSAQTLNREATAILFCTVLVQGAWEIKIMVSGIFLRKMSRNDSAPTRVERFLEALVVIIFIINRIAEIVIDSISAAQITEIISHAMTTFITK